jgi:hypothetical protein
MCELRHTSLVVQKMHLRTPSPPAEKTTARLRYMRKYVRRRRAAKKESPGCSDRGFKENPHC